MFAQKLQLPGIYNRRSRDIWDDGLHGGGDGMTGAGACPVLHNSQARSEASETLG